MIVVCSFESIFAFFLPYSKDFGAPRSGSGTYPQRDLRVPQCFLGVPVAYLEGTCSVSGEHMFR